MKRFKGIIALDIDGTITVFRDRLDDAVNDFLNKLIAEEWLVVFITGRTFSFTEPMIARLTGAFYVAVQNGAALFEMPAGKPIAKHYLPITTLDALVPCFSEGPIGLLIESGKEASDRCYYTPHAFSAEELVYLRFRMSISKEAWVALDDFSQLPLQEFAVGKYFANKAQADRLSERIAHTLSVHSIVIRDPFRPDHYLAHINAPDASKGRILSEFRALFPPMPVLAAGDDWNDKEMLACSTYKIVMSNGPKEMHALADLLAPPAKENGIIPALQEAIRTVEAAQDLRP